MMNCQSSSVHDSRGKIETGNGTIEAESEDTEPSEEYQPTREEYDRAFQEIEEIILSFNTIIQKREYDKWLSFLTPEYMEKKSDPVYLRELSEKPMLKNQNVVIHNLKDYFYHIVVPSRINAPLDKIAFIDDTHVKAYTYVESDDEYVILFFLEKQNDIWKISVW
ncbi:MAG: hypothetical protein JW881_09850 [Spirochaetales bacterium]|nr:hypothetical protein [Spirochaetales bacterium]